MRKHVSRPQNLKQLQKLHLYFPVLFLSSILEDISCLAEFIDACDNINQQKSIPYMHISEEQLIKLSDNPSIRKALLEPGIRSLILSITSSDDPRQSLSNARTQYLPFEQFVNDLLDCIDFHPSREPRTLQPTIVHRLFESLGIDLNSLN